MTEQPETFEQWRARTATPKASRTPRDWVLAVLGYLVGAAIGVWIDGWHALAVAAGSVGFAAVFGASRWWANRRAARG